MDSTTRQSRRDFMRNAAAGAAILGAPAILAQEQRPLTIGLVGCGRRGTGAVRDCLSSNDQVSLIAIGDLFPEQVAAGRTKLESLGEKVKLTDERCFEGFDAYQKVIDSGPDIIFLCTPPGYRPIQLKAAIAAGKHVFMEKPVAVDPAGIRSVLESAEAAKEQSLSIVAGTQRRHQAPYIDIVKRVQDGAIGELVAANCYWVGDYGYYPAVKREDWHCDVGWQIRNWNYFTWLSGDHIVEQHVHNIDIMNWALGGPPKRAFGLGGRQQRMGEEYGHIYDHFSIEFEYAHGLRVQSLCRQNANTYNRVGEWLVGTKGTADPARGIRGEKPYRFRGEAPNPYQQEHVDLITAIRAGAPLNEARQIAESTMTAIMGRLAAYSGQEVTWDFVMNESQLALTPAMAFGKRPVEAVAVPGVYTLV